jgi:hypothetical protein
MYGGHGRGGRPVSTINNVLQIWVHKKPARRGLAIQFPNFNALVNPT